MPFCLWSAPISSTQKNAAPQRTCLACGLKTEQSKLLRLVRLSDGVVAIDAERRKPGRGGYVCSHLACAKLLQRKKALSRGFRAKIDDAAYDVIISYIEKNS